MEHEQTYQEIKAACDRLWTRFTDVQNKYIDLQKRFRQVESVVVQLKDENRKLKETDHSRVEIQGNPYIVST